MPTSSTKTSTNRKSTTATKRPAASRPASTARKPAPKPATPVAVEQEPIDIPAAQRTSGTISSTASWQSERKVEKPATPVEPQYVDDDRVCVTIGYGANDLNSQSFMVGNVRFGRDRIARSVTYKDAKAMQRIYTDGVCRIHPNDATVAEIAKRCGVRPGDPAKIAALLLASNLDDIADQFSPEELTMLAQKLADKALGLRKSA